MMTWLHVIAWAFLVIYLGWSFYAIVWRRLKPLVEMEVELRQLKALKEIEDQLNAAERRQPSEA